MVLQLTLRASLLANILLAVSLRQFTPHSLLRQRLQRESLLRQGTALHCSNDAVPFTLKDRLLCHLPSDHTKDFHGNEITFTGPSAPSRVIEWDSQPQRLLLLAKDDPDLLPVVTDALKYLVDARGLQVALEERLLRRLMCFEAFVSWVGAQRAAAASNAAEDTAIAEPAAEGTRPRLGSQDIDESVTMIQLGALHPQLSVFTPTSTLDLVITFGGDGLLLHANTLFQGRAIPPVMCFDFGSLGFLTPFQYAHFQQEVDDVLAGSALLTLRMRLQCTIYRNNQPEEVYHVLNEVVIDRGPSPYLSVLDLSCDDQYLTTLQGDGVIFATPTGSTAYSLAAGGSIVYPAVPAICLTPICAHSLSFRPMLLPDSAVLVCEVPKECRASGWVSLDGKYRQELQRGCRLQVAMSPYPMPTLNKKSFTGDWFDALRASFMFNMRPRQKPHV